MDRKSTKAEQILNCPIQRAGTRRRRYPFTPILQPRERKQQVRAAERRLSRIPARALAPVIRVRNRRIPMRNQRVPATLAAMLSKKIAIRGACRVAFQQD
jgi:hypothetical protein